MTEFGETTIVQTTLASMFPISYSLLTTLMSPRTPQPLAPLAPEKVRPLVLAPFSLSYTGFLKISDLNTELLFFSRAICAPTQSVAGGTGVIGGQALLIDINFNNVTIDDVTVPLVIQGLILTGNLSITGASTSLGIVHIGYNTIGGSLIFSEDITLASLELYDCVVSADITLPSGPSVVSLLIYGQYPQLTLEEVSSSKAYPSLSSLMYLNGVDGKGERDIPSGARGFGAYTLTGLTQTSYPLITTLAIPDPWSIPNLETLFPNLLNVYAPGYPAEGAVTIPATPQSRYSSLTVIGASRLTSMDLSNRASSLIAGIRIVGCPLLTAVILRSDPQTLTPLREYRTLVIERCGLLYLRGARGLTRPPTTLRLGDHTAPVMSVSPHNASRILDYVLQAQPTLGQGSTISAVAGDYLPNVIVALAEQMPHLILYPVMQTVEYSLARPAAVVAADPAGGLTTTYTQYSGGSNPVVPTSGTLTNAVITVSPFGIRYNIRIAASSLSDRNVTVPTVSTASKRILHLDPRAARIAMIVAAIVGGLIIVAAVVGTAIATLRQRRSVLAETRELKLKK